MDQYLSPDRNIWLMASFCKSIITKCYCVHALSVTSDAKLLDVYLDSLDNTEIFSDRLSKEFEMDRDTMGRVYIRIMNYSNIRSCEPHLTYI